VAHCPKCGLAVIESTLPNGHQLILESAPHPDGQVLSINGGATFLDGPTLAEARRVGLPVYRRHNVFCREIYKRID
jgi:hypothetical protein